MIRIIQIVKLASRVVIVGRSTVEVARANRERVLDQAVGRLNERGLNGIGVADLMAAAGMTHGGFYRHFDSKEQLAAEAVERAARAGADGWRALGDEARTAGRPSALHEILDTYLCKTHQEAVAKGCAVAGIGCELVRLPDDLRSRVAGGIEDMINALAAEMPASDEPERRHEATFALGAMVGALLLARLGVGGDNELTLVADRLKAWSLGSSSRFGVAVEEQERGKC